MSTEITGSAIASAMSSASSASAADAGASGSTPSPAAAGVSPALESSSTQTAATDGTTAATTAATVDPTKPTTEVKPQGPIPFDTHKTALENARTKAAQETEAKFGWAATIPEQHRETVGQFYKLLDAEPTHAVEVLITQIANDPQHAPKLRSLFGRLLGTRAQSPAPGQPATGGYPDPDIEGTDDKGNSVGLYSAAAFKAALEQAERRITDALTKKYGPLEQDFQTRQQREQQAENKRQADAWADKEYTRLSQYRGFKEHEREIAQAMQASPDLSVQDAYIQVVVPKLDSSARQSVAASLHDKSQAASIHPNNQTTATTGRPKTFLEGFKQVGAQALAG